MPKFRKNISGFTLIEVLVTVVIVAVLAAIAIPIYTSYITSQREAVVQDLADTGAAAANSFYRRTGADPTDVGQLNLFISDTARYTASISGTSIEVTDNDHSITKSTAFR